VRAFDVNGIYHFGNFCGQFVSSGGHMTLNLHLSYKLQQICIERSFCFLDHR